MTYKTSIQRNISFDGVLTLERGEVFTDDQELGERVRTKLCTANFATQKEYEPKPKAPNKVGRKRKPKPSEDKQLKPGENK